MAESPTAPRFTFADRRVGRVDSLYSDGYREMRVISYPAPIDPEMTQLREHMIDTQRVWGRPTGEGHRAVVAFQVPNSLRPIAHDVSSRGQGAYEYGDAELFFDLGRLLGALAQAGPEKPYVLGSVGDNIGIKEFTRVGEPTILLVPGFENVVTTLDTEDEVRQTYERALSGEFPQFPGHRADFEDGFAAGTGIN